jgi:hypothetical protein
MRIYAGLTAQNLSHMQGAQAASPQSAALLPACAALEAMHAN